jgi:hypothetical protein
LTFETVAALHPFRSFRKGHRGSRLKLKPPRFDSKHRRFDATANYS